MAIQPTQRQGIGVVLDTAFDLFQSSFGKVWPISALMAVVNMVPLVYLFIVGLPSVDPSRLENPFKIYSDHPMMVVVGIICGVVSLWLASALLLQQRALGTDQELSTGSAFQQALPRVLPVFGASILFGLAVLMGLLLLLVPGLILMVSLLLYMVIQLFEHKGAFDSLASSHRLVWGNWWRTSAVLTMMSILLFVILFALGFVSALLIPVAGVTASDAVMIGLVMQAVTNLALYVFLVPFASAALIALYWDLKLRKEGSDLVARVNALSAA